MAMFERETYKAECGHQASSAVGVPRKRFCSMDCAAEFMTKRSEAFAKASAPPDGVTYAASKRAQR